MMWYQLPEYKTQDIREWRLGIETGRSIVRLVRLGNGKYGFQLPFEPGRYSVDDPFVPIDGNLTLDEAQEVAKAIALMQQER